MATAADNYNFLHMQIIAQLNKFWFKNGTNFGHFNHAYLRSFGKELQSNYQLDVRSQQTSQIRLKPENHE